MRHAVITMVLVPFVVVGCYAPLRSPGVSASALPDSFRVPVKELSAELNFAVLTRESPRRYLLGKDDVIRVEISDLTPRGRRLNPRDPNLPVDHLHRTSVADVKLDEQGRVLMPLVGNVNVGGLSIAEARDKIIRAYSNGFLDKPQIAVSLLEESTSRIIVLGSVARPGVYELPKYENDVAHAITVAGGLLPDSADEIQIHRKWSFSEPSVLKESDFLEANELPMPDVAGSPGNALADEAPRHELEVIRIPLRSNPPIMLSPEQVTLNDSDVVIVKSFPDEVFFVVGRLSTNNLVRFSLGRDNRDLGNGFVLPKDRDIDVVTAVAMAGYIDPIESPTTVTVHRLHADGTPFLIRVDLIAARTNQRENVMVRPGDIIYLNPDGAWWFRQALDRVLPNLITSPYTEWMERLINPGRFNAR